MMKPIFTIIQSVCYSIPIFFVIGLLATSFSVSSADEGVGISVGRPVTADKITVDSVNLTAQHFFKSYMSNSADERKNSELYLLGVMDATEGKSWCDYRTFKTITLRERIFEEFKKLGSRQFNERASKVIGDILSRRYPCGQVK